MAQVVPATSQPVALAGKHQFERMYNIAALGVLLGAFCSFLGAVWDIQWHEDVGPDTFFTLPHLLIYSSALFSGLSALAVVLTCTWFVRLLKRPPAIKLVSLFWGTFWGPVGFILSGIGGALYLFFGPYDLWWHTVYGFDATLFSPPHVGLGLADTTMMFGSVCIFADLVTRHNAALFNWRVFGLGAALSIFLINSTVYQDVVPGIGGVTGSFLFVGILYAFVLCIAASVTRRIGAATLVSIIFLCLKASGWIFSTWATPVYAASVGLFLRDDAFGFPRILAPIPTYLFVAGIFIDVALFLVLRAKRESLLPRIPPLATGLGFGIVTLLETLLPVTFFAAPDTIPVLTACVVVFVSAGAAWLGWAFGIVLRKVHYV